MTTFDAVAEFDRQTETLLAMEYPVLAGDGRERARSLVQPLRELVAARDIDPPLVSEGKIPFLLVVTRSVVPLEELVTRTTLAGKSKPGVVDRNYGGTVAKYVSTKEAQIPAADAYLLFDVERGEEFCGVVPNAAMAIVAERDRTLLTIEEGLALITHYPEVLVKNKCFSLGGSRADDRRVPAVWISQNAPKLGWCWEGNPHTWLGMASAGSRAAAT